VSALALALVLGAGCSHPALGDLPAARQASACALLGQPAPPPGIAPARALASIYAEPGFERARQRDSGAMRALLAQLKERLLALFETSGAQAYSNFTRVLVLAVALAAGLALVLARRRKGSAAGASRRAGAAGAPVLEAPAAHLDRARAAVAAAPREALREGLLALLSSLELRRLARPDRVKTNQELVEELPRRGAPAGLTAAVAELVAAYDVKFYSLAPVSEEDARGFLAGVEPLLGIAGAR
jgi:hypothetical protein